jgi:hypothetical protein
LVWQPHRIAVGQGDGARVIEATHAADAPVAMVKRAVLLHQDHHVLGIKIGRARCGVDRQGLLDRGGIDPATRRQQGGLLQEIAS